MLPVSQEEFSLQLVCLICCQVKLLFLGFLKGALKTSLIILVPYKCSLVPFLAPLNRHQIKHSSPRVGGFVYRTSSHTP